jgi:hypothetical protein
MQAGAAAAPQKGLPWRRCWTLKGRGGDALIVRRRDVRAGETFRAALPVELRRWQNDSRNRAAFCAMYSAEFRCAAVGAGTFFAGGLSTRVLTRVEEAFRRGRLLVQAKSNDWSIIAAPRKAIEEAAAAAKLAKKNEKTWIEIQLVDQKGSPVAGASYRMKITDGSVREGVTDENGSVRVPGIDPGTCEVSFPDYDAREWKRA